MPSFLSYFNQGPLNYEEQTINWVKNLYAKLDALIEAETGLKTSHFLKFYENLDALVQRNFQGFSSPKGTLRPNWEAYTKMPIVPAPHMPAMMMDMFEERKPLMSFVSDHGIINRFYPDEKTIENSDMIVTTPDLPAVFDKQYHKGMDFENEKLLGEEKSGKYMFW